MWSASSRCGYGWVSELQCVVSYCKHEKEEEELGVGGERGVWGQFVG